jgi:glycosyltransferase involved in cell wall biosynthesis
LLVPARDSAALAAATGRLLDEPDLASRLGQAGIRRVAELYSIAGSVHETELLYKRLVDLKGCL